MDSHQVNVERLLAEAKLKALLSDESLSAQNETIKVSFKNYIPLDNATLSLTTRLSFLVLFHLVTGMKALIKYYITAVRPINNFATFTTFSD